MRRQRVYLKVANMTKMARNRSGDFEGDGKYAENGKDSLKPYIEVTKLTNLAKMTKE